MTAHGRAHSGSPGRESRAAKDAVRARVLAARRALSDVERADRSTALAAHAAALVADVHGPVCAYLPLRTEPGGDALVAALAGGGRTVLVPVVSDADAPMEWARHLGPTTATSLGIREPVGTRLGAGAITGATLVLVPALAVDHSGTRLGRGRGHYDRTLPLAGPDALVVAVIDDDELVDALPTEPHDRPVTAVLTPRAGLVHLPGPARNRS